jgi:hypothetical protein
MKSRWQKIVLLSVLGFVAAVDLVHAILNRIYHPFTGPLDTAMHFVLLPAIGVYLIFCLWGCFWLARFSSGTKFLSKNQSAIAILLLVLILGELAFTLLIPARSGSSRYHPLFPDFLGGIFLAMATMIAGREYLKFFIGRVFVVLLFFFWIAGSLTVDLLWWTEGTRRGVGPMWHLPLITPMLTAIAYIFIFGGELVGWCLYLPEGLFNAGPIIEGGWLLVLTLSVAGCLRWLSQSRSWLTPLALAASAIFLCWKALEWSSFIAD